MCRCLPRILAILSYSISTKTLKGEYYYLHFTGHDTDVPWDWAPFPRPSLGALNSLNKAEQKATTINAHSSYQDKYYFYANSAQRPPRCFYTFSSFQSPRKSSCISDHLICLSWCIYTAIKQCLCWRVATSSWYPVLGGIFIHSYIWKTKLDGDFNSSESGQMLSSQYANKPPKHFFSLILWLSQKPSWDLCPQTSSFKIMVLMTVITYPQAHR